MPGETIAISLPAAFLACVQCFELIQIGRNFKDDQALSKGDLDMCQIHLQRWGSAAGLDQEGQDPTQLPDRLSKYPEKELQKAARVMKQIESSFERAREDCDYEQERDTGEAALPGDAEGSEQSQGVPDSKLEKCLVHFAKVKAKYRSKMDTAKAALLSASHRTKWAIYKKKQVTALVERVSGMIGDLEKLFPELLEVEKQLAKDEVKDAEEEVVKALPALAAGIDPVMAQAATTQAKAYGMTFGDVDAGGYSSVHLGNAYAKGEKSTGHDNHTFGNLKFSGNAAFHGGNSYGFGPRVLSGAVQNASEGDGSTQHE